MIMLRPELTPTLARVIAQRQRQLTYPLRWWSYGPFWRYEAPQKGRSREFFQWNIDQIGIDSPEADAELVAIIAALFQEIGLTPEEVAILVNDRKLVNRELEKLGIKGTQHQDALSWIDRRAKLKPAAWEAYGKDIGLSTKQINGTIDFLENKEIWQESETLVQVFPILEAMGAKEYVKYDSNVIRGLPYYTGIVFEAFDVRGSVRRSILGGGRYDNLMEAVGGDPMPAVGFAMGDLVISVILKELGRLPEGIDASPAPVMVTIFDDERSLDSFKFASELRADGLKVSVYPVADKLGKQFKYADRIGAQLAVVLGPDELTKGEVAIKDLKTRSQENFPRKDAVETIRQMLAGDDSP
jgi:histidyl-tRNA synthetase